MNLGFECSLHKICKKGFSPTCILSYKDWIDDSVFTRENTGQWIPYFAYFMQWLVISPQHCYGWGDTRYWTKDTRSLSLSIVRQDSSLFPLRLLENKPNWATKEYVHYFFQAKDFIIDITHGQINTILFLLFFICFQCLVSFSFSNFWFVLSLTSAFYLQTFHCNDILTSYLIEKYHRTHWIWISSKLNLINFQGTRSWYFGQLFFR